MIYKFYQLGVAIRWRSLKCGGTNATNERIADKTNETNERISDKTNDVNAENVRLTNESNERMNRENNELQIQLQEDMNKFNLDMWNLNNEYNSPEQQLQRAAQAGINPNVVFGSPVESSPVQQSSVASTTPSRNQAAVAHPYQAVGSVATPEGSLAGALSRTIGDLNSSINAIGQHYQNESQRMQNDFLPAMLSTGLQGSQISNDLNRARTKEVEAQSKLIMKQADGVVQGILESQQKIRNMQGELNILDEKAYQAKIDSAFYYDEKDQNLKNIKQQYEFTDTQMYAITQGLKIQSMVAYATANNLNWQSKVAEAEAAYKNRCIELGMPEMEFAQVKAAVNLATSQNDAQMLKNDVYLKFGSDIMKYNVDDARYRTTTLSRFISGTRDVMMSAGAAAFLLK